jgi:hypothetical protein
LALVQTVPSAIDSQSIVACAATKLTQGCSGSAATIARAQWKYLLMVRDPRELTISEYFFKPESRTGLTLEEFMYTRLPANTAWTGTRFELLQQEARIRSQPQLGPRMPADVASSNVGSDGRAPAASSRTGSPVFAVMYDMLRRTSFAYQQICWMLEFEHCPHEMLARVKESLSASNMKDLEK